MSLTWKDRLVNPSDPAAQDRPQSGPVVESVRALPLNELRVEGRNSSPWLCASVANFFVTFVFFVVP
jgi:hypothetical protein